MKKIESGEVISYTKMCDIEKTNLQKGMNFHLRRGISVILMSLRKNAPYADKIEDEGKILIYEGHNVPKIQGMKDEPNKMNQLLKTSKGTLTENGKFFQAALNYKNGIGLCEKVRVYEKIKTGMWVYNGVFELIDAWAEKSDGRIVYKFKLKLSDSQNVKNDIEYIEHTRIIPSEVKREVWKRDKGRCVLCHSDKMLQFDHIIPYSKGGTSISANNIQLLCSKCNAKKRDKIE